VKQTHVALKRSTGNQFGPTAFLVYSTYAKFKNYQAVLHLGFQGEIIQT